MPSPYQPSTHDWRPGDRIASIAVNEPTYKTGLGTIQRIILNKAVVVWDDGKQSVERLQDLIYGGYDKSKVILKSEWYGDGYDGLYLSTNLQKQISDDFSKNTERIAVNRVLISGLPLDNIGNLVKWGV